MVDSKRPEAVYEERHATRQKDAVALDRREARIANLRLAVFAAALVWLVVAWGHRRHGSLVFLCATGHSEKVLRLPGRCPCKPGRMCLVFDRAMEAWVFKRAVV